MSSTKVIPTTKQVSPKRAAKLTDQQRMFCHEVLASRGFNYKEAAERAGYKNPGVAAAKLLQNKLVCDYLGMLIGKRMTRTDATAERVVEELANIGFFNPKQLLKEDGSLIDIKDLPDELACCIQSMDISFTEDMNEDGVYTTVKNVKLRFYDKLVALGYLARHLGMLNDKIQVKGEVGVSGDLIGTLLTRIESMGVVDADYIERKAEEGGD